MTPDEYVADVVFLLEVGENLHGIAARLRVTEDHLLLRVGRQDRAVASRLRASVQPPPMVLSYQECRRIARTR